ncbi:MAG: hypothetical protein AAFN04_16875, partial [Pseudomonadota bacterium]
PEPPLGELLLTKTTPLETVFLGSSVSYTITIENLSAFNVTTDLVDRLPPGFVYTPDTATIDGVAVEPEATGSSLIWEDVDVPFGATLTLELVTRVGPDTPIGELVNTVTAVDPLSGAPQSASATAVVRRDPEAVFDCSDVIGKVFDDRNFDGYQNPIDRRRAAEHQEGEPGLPRVRLVTATGTIIKTDEYGRFSVPCAELPREMGTNFTLKLDPRSLPTGYRVTTENPRTMRLTAGIHAEMNFGAAIGRVIDIDLTASAFQSNDEPIPRLLDGLDQALPQVAREPSVLRLSYFADGEGSKRIRRRLDRLEDKIQARWRRIGQYRLIIERNIKSN